MINFFFKIFCLSLIISSVSGLELKTGYFFFSDSKMRTVYNRGGWDVQLSDSYSLCQLTHYSTLDAYGAIEYFQKSGKSIHGHERTSIWAVPINFGFKFNYMINENVQSYFGTGPRLVYIHQHNHSPYVNKSKSGSCLGFFANTGLYYTFCNCFLIDIFGEYSYAKIRFPSNKCNFYSNRRQVGGATFGGGIGYNF